MRQPVGVVAAITPFNFPAMIPLWFLPFAIACGNTFILKPSERDPRPSELIFELIDGIEEIPAGVFNLVHGARDAVNALLDHPGDRRDLVRRPGLDRALRRRALGGRPASACQALGGAKNSLVVMPDADLDVTVPAIMGSAFGAAGQRCLAGSVAVLVGDATARTRSARRSPTPPPSLASARRRTPTSRRLPAGRSPRRASGSRTRSTAREAEGAEVVARRPRRDAGPAGTMLGPTIVETADPESELAREELFGPLLTLVARRRPRRRARVRQRLALRQRRLDLHHLGRRGPRATATASRPG